MNTTAQWDDRLSAHATRPQRFPWFIFLVAVVALFLIGHEFRFALRFQEFTQEQDPTTTTVAIAGGRLIRQVSGLALGMLGALSLLAAGRRPVRIRGFMAGLVVFLLGWAYLSLLWSEQPGLAFRRLVSLTMLILGAVMVSERATLRHFVWFVLLMTSAYLLVGIGTEVALRTFTPWSGGYRFSGTHHPNNQATDCGLLLLAALTLIQTERRWRVPLIVIALVAAAFLFLTKSRSGMVAVVGAPLIYWGLVRSGAAKLLLLSAAVTAIGAVFLLGDVVFPVLRTGVDLGREESATSSLKTLTGRTPLWRDCIEYAAERPLLGYGYDSFWDADRLRLLSEKHDWVIPDGHNIYVDVMLQLGPVGLVAFVLVMLLGIRRSLVYHRATGDATYAFLGSVLVFCVLIGVLESVMLVRMTFTFIAITVVVYLAFQEPPARTDAADLPQDAPSAL
ncbi:MAG: hypothetical protein GWP08_11020 [Nitrospiraceae bacterium]|nr:hypothetical protein [Nitrospiraceae bacterium]